MMGLFKEIFIFTNIRNCSYFGRRLHLSERLWWTIAVGLLVLFCGVSISKVWMKWAKYPVKMSPSFEGVPISNIPFPTVTICPMTKLSKDKLDLNSAYRTFEKWPKINNFTDLQRAQMEVLHILCNFDRLPNEHFGHKLINESVYKLIHDMAPAFYDTMFFCMWQTKARSCMETFVPVITELGLCYAFNMLNSWDVFTNETASELLMNPIGSNNPNVSQWTIEHGYTNATIENSFPLRTFTVRRKSSLITYLRLAKRDIEYLCHRFQVILSTPGDALRIPRHMFRILDSELVKVFIRSRMESTSNDLRYLRPEQRQCFFSNERQLRFYKFFTKNNCESECVANFTIQCGCAMFFMPRDKHTQICGLKNYQCYQSARRLLQGIFDEHAKSFHEQCNCLNGCTTISYIIDIDRADAHLDDFIRSYSPQFYESDENTRFKFSYLSVSLKSNYVDAIKRSSSYTLSSFLAKCGALLGLFLGLSTMSVMQFAFIFLLHLHRIFRKLQSRDDTEPSIRSVIHVRPRKIPTIPNQNLTSDD